MFKSFRLCVTYGGAYSIFVSVYVCACTYTCKYSKDIHVGISVVGLQRGSCRGVYVGCCTHSVTVEQCS